MGRNYIEQDEIDLKDLFVTIWNKKFFILIFTFLITFLSIVYVFFKNPVPVYKGKVYIEIGQIQSQNFAQLPLDIAVDLSEILKLQFSLESNIMKAAIRNNTNLLEITSSSENKEEIKNNLNKAIDFIMSRHNEKAKFYQNVIMTKQIGMIEVDENPINKPKKLLIVVTSFIIGFILSIFLVFLIEFINNFKKEENKWQY